jgi:hypothetical protein
MKTKKYIFTLLLILFTGVSIFHSSVYASGGGGCSGCECDNTCEPDPECSNGATNYPTCTPPPTPSCANGASNYPLCTIIQPVCANGASNYPLCTIIQPVCANGATDYPICTPPKDLACLPKIFKNLPTLPSKSFFSGACLG